MLKIDNFKEIIVANWKLNGSFSFVEEYQQKISSQQEELVKTQTQL